MTTIGTRIGRGVMLLSALLIIGVGGYMLIEEWSFLDALYMTVVTFTTVGFQEVHTPSPAGRIFTIFLMTAGVATMVYFLSSIMQAILEYETLNRFVKVRRMRKRLAGERNHFILCGFGRVGREVAAAFNSDGFHFIVVDPDTEAIAEANELGYAFVQGDATQDAILKSAGIDNAQALVASVGDDSYNVFISLTAKSLNPAVRIVTRAVDSENSEKLLRAGADQVISPFSIGGRSLALAAVHPQTADIMYRLSETLVEEFEGLRMIRVESNSPLSGSTVRHSADELKLLILALTREGEATVYQPDGEEVIKLGDTVLAAVTEPA